MSRKFGLLVAMLVALPWSTYAWAEGNGAAPLGGAEQASIARDYATMFADPSFQSQLDAALKPKFAAQQQLVDEKLTKLKETEIPAAVATAMAAERKGLAAAARDAVVAAAGRTSGTTTAPASTVTGGVLPGAASGAQRVTVGNVNATAQAGAVTRPARDPNMTYFRHKQGTGVPMPASGSFEPCPICHSTGSCIVNYSGASSSSGGYVQQNQTCRQNADGSWSCPNRGSSSSGYISSGYSSGGSQPYCPSCQRNSFGW